MRLQFRQHQACTATYVAHGLRRQLLPPYHPLDLSHLERGFLDVPGGIIFQVATVSVNSAFRVDADQRTKNPIIVLPKGEGSHGVELLYLPVFTVRPT
jgi:hypothetical protein